MQHLQIMWGLWCALFHQFQVLFLMKPDTWYLVPLFEMNNNMTQTEIEMQPFVASNEINLNWKLYS